MQIRIIQVLGLLVDSTCYNFCEESDARRIDFAEQYLGTSQKDNQKKNLMTSMYSRKDNFMGQTSQIEGKLKNSDFIIKKSVKKFFNVFFSKYTFLKLCKIIFKLFNRLT